MRELRDELAARRAGRAGDEAARRGMQLARTIRMAAPAAAVLILVGLFEAL